MLSTASLRSGNQTASGKFTEALEKGDTRDALEAQRAELETQRAAIEKRIAADDARIAREKREPLAAELKSLGLKDEPMLRSLEIKIKNCIHADELHLLRCEYAKLSNERSALSEPITARQNQIRRELIASAPLEIDVAIATLDANVIDWDGCRKSRSVDIGNKAIAESNNASIDLSVTAARKAQSLLGELKFEAHSPGELQKAIGKILKIVPAPNFEVK